MEKKEVTNVKKKKKKKKKSEENRINQTSRRVGENIRFQVSKQWSRVGRSVIVIRRLIGARPKQLKNYF